MTTNQYDDFTNGNLLTSFDWFADCGGDNSTANLREVENFFHYTDEEQDEFSKHIYTLVVKVTAPERRTLYLDPSGYNYARYVGFNLQPETLESQATEEKETPDPS